MFVAGRFINRIVGQISYDKDRLSTSSGFYILLEAALFRSLFYVMFRRL